MELTYVERLILTNQYKILEKLYPEEARQYALTRESLEAGYVLEYGLISGPTHQQLSADDCREVRDTLDMYRAIRTALALTTDARLHASLPLHFAGFDSETEALHKQYTHFLFRQGRWAELSQDATKDCLRPMLGRYRAMLAQWRTLPHKHRLTEDDLHHLDATGSGQ